MICSRRAKDYIFRAVGLFFLAAVFMGVYSPAVGAGESRKTIANDPWSGLVTGAKGEMHFPALCHELKFFSGNPLHFDYEQDFFGWPPDSFTYTNEVSLIGTVQKHRIYQVMQNTHHKPGKPPSSAWGDVQMRRIIVERTASEYCLIYQETNSYGILHQIDPATLGKIDGSPVLAIHDPVEGNGAYYNDVAWTFNAGVPVRLRFGPLIDQVFKEVAPHGCTLPPKGDPLDLDNFTYSGELALDFKYRKDADAPSCGSISISFGIRNHKLIVVDKQYAPRQ